MWVAVVVSQAVGGFASRAIPVIPTLCLVYLSSVESYEVRYEIYSEA